MSRVFIGAVAVLLVQLWLISVGWIQLHFGRERAETQEEVVERVVVVDTLHYGSIAPIRVTAIERSEVETESGIERKDSLYLFNDKQAGRWSAEVVGQNVELRSLTLHDKVTHERVVQRELPKWDIALKSAIAPRQLWFGVGVTRRIGRLSLTLDCGYDQWCKQPYVGASASLSLWREWGR